MPDLTKLPPESWGWALAVAVTMAAISLMAWLIKDLRAEGKQSRVESMAYLKVLDELASTVRAVREQAAASAAMEQSEQVMNAAHQATVIAKLDAMREAVHERA